MLSKTEIWFENAPMGQRVRLVELPHETGGRRAVLEAVTRPRAGRDAVVEHVHPAATETFEVLSGRARCLVNRREIVAAAGESIVMPANVPHVHPWSDSDEELRVRQTIELREPDLKGLIASVQALITIFGFASAGRANRTGLPPLLQLALLVHESMPATYLAALPRAAQRPLFGVLARVARLCGYQAAYPEYGILTDRGLFPPNPAVVFETGRRTAPRGSPQRAV